MIKITSCKADGDLRLRLTFSDGSTGIWNAAPLLASKDTPLTIRCASRRHSLAPLSTTARWHGPTG